MNKDHIVKLIKINMLKPSQLAPVSPTAMIQHSIDKINNV